MEPLRQINQFWNWLPAFRAVGECEHLPQAGELLHTSPSALSRSVKLLEEAMGHTLFLRDGRTIKLNESGEAFLAAVRDAMRIVHEGLLSVRSERLSGRIKLASSGVATTALLAPALAQLRTECPDLQAHVTSDLTDAVARVLRGDLDLILQSRMVNHPRMHTEHLTDIECGVYCGPSHPLFKRRKVTMDDILSHEFVAALPEDDAPPQDGWPPALPRKFAFYVDQMRVGADVCVHEPLLVVLPEPVARASGGGALRLLPVDVVPPVPVFASYRHPLGIRTRALAIVETVRGQISSGRSAKRGSPKKA